MTVNTEDNSTDTVKFLGVKFVSNVDWASLLSTMGDGNSSQQRDVKPVRLLIHQGTPIVYNQRYVVPILGELIGPQECGHLFSLGDCSSIWDLVQIAHENLLGQDLYLQIGPSCEEF